LARTRKASAAVYQPSLQKTLGKTIGKWNTILSQMAQPIDETKKDLNPMPQSSRL
jgi:hypothetical protein